MNNLLNSALPDTRFTPARKKAMIHLRHVKIIIEQVFRHRTEQVP